MKVPEQRRSLKLELLGRGARVAGEAPPRLPARLRILYTTYYDSIANSGPFFGYYFFNSLLMLLQLLHVFWSFLVLRMLHSFTKKGQVGPSKGGLAGATPEPQPRSPSASSPLLVPQLENDIRSDMEESDSSEGEAAQECLRLKNGAAPGSGAAPADGPRSRAARQLPNGHMSAT